MKTQIQKQIEEIRELREQIGEIMAALELAFPGTIKPTEDRSTNPSKENRQ